MPLLLAASYAKKVPKMDHVYGIFGPIQQTSQSQNQTSSNQQWCDLPTLVSRTWTIHMYFCLRLSSLWALGSKGRPGSLLSYSFRTQARLIVFIRLAFVLNLLHHSKVAIPGNNTRTCRFLVSKAERTKCGQPVMVPSVNLYFNFF